MVSRGAKVAMTVALQFSNSVADIVAVDNAPIEANLGKDFASYIRGMKEIDVAGISRQAEADKILQRYEEVGIPEQAKALVFRYYDVKHFSCYLPY